jgi:peptide/nickel transport system substrate-binding protein
MSRHLVGGARPWRPGLSTSLIGVLAFLLACSPGTTTPTASERNAEPSAPAAPKTLVMALQEEPISIVIYGRPGEGGVTSARFERYYMFHANLTMYDEANNVAASAAEKVPSVQDGDWKVNPDGTMDITWKIRPDVRWHDGTPLTADDFVFGFEVIRDPKLRVAGLGEVLNIAGVHAVDDRTLVVNWKKVSIQGNTNSTEGVPAVPRHLLEELYRTSDPVVFEGLPVWRDDFVGLGPYRISNWMQGSSIEAEAFPQFFQGRPKIDRIIMRWVTDVNVLAANLLAGVVDVSPPGTTMKPEQLLEVRRQWGPEGGQVFTAPTDIRTMTINTRRDMPWAQDVRFRQAMLHSLNREQLVDALQSGMTDIAWYLNFPSDPIYKLADQRGLAKYPYDPATAQRLFAQAGWTKGPDGMLRNSAGEALPTFFCCRYPSGDSNDTRESLAFGADLKAAGIDAVHPLNAAPAGLSSSETRRVQITGDWGGLVGNFRITTDQSWSTLTAHNIARAETAWVGINNSGWTNPAYEDLFTKQVSTLDVAPRQEIEYQLFKMMVEELPLLPAYYNPLGVVVRKGVEGVGKGAVLNRGVTWNIHTWDIK